MLRPFLFDPAQMAAMRGAFRFVFLLLGLFGLAGV